MALDIESVKQWVESYGPPAVGVGSMMDNTGVPIFFVVGLAMARAVQVHPGAMWLAAFLGSVVGDLGTYAIGRYYLTKEKLLLNPLGQRMGPMLRAGERTIGRWGPWSIVFGRFLPYIGKVLPMLAGSYLVSWPVATLSVIAGSFLLTGFFFMFANVAFQVVSGHGTAVRVVSLAIGAAALCVLIGANVALQRREQFQAR
jgi:membrane protein DedA with SNARE-associated domain